MSAAQQAAPPSWRKSAWRWLKRIVLSLFLIVALLAGVGLIIRAFLFSRAEKEWEAAAAQLDVADPGWRWENVLAGRKEVPERQNSAPHVRAAACLLPEKWPTGARDDLSSSLRLAPPNRRPDEAVAGRLRKELKELAPAITEARKVSGLSADRYEVAWRKYFFSTAMPHLKELRPVAELLSRDATLRAYDGDLERAFGSALDVIHVGQSLGDEPVLLSLTVRSLVDAAGVRSLERVLGQGTVSPKTLEAGQEQLRLAEQPALLQAAFRGERAAVSEAIGMVRFEVGTIRGLLGADEPPRHLEDRLYDWAVLRALVPHNQKAYLVMMTRAVEAAGLPFREQRKAARELAREADTMRDSSRLWLAGLVAPDFPKVVDRSQRRQAELSCARVGLAVERYRLAEGRWPETLDQLTPKLRAGVPEDPFSRGPLLYRRLSDGVVVYSVGPDERDNGGAIDRDDPTQAGADLGFRLWDIMHRGQ